MKRTLRHLLSQPFVLTTGFAALVHSTWSLATLFNGPEPVFAWSGPWFAWIAPALFIAFSVDVGQIITAAEIRAGQRSKMKYATFATFAIATYLLQWFHLAHHIPTLELSAGVQNDQIALAQFLREAMLWCIPALLPVSTLLYTFSSRENEERKETTPFAAIQINNIIPAQPAVEAKAPIATISEPIAQLSIESGEPPVPSETFSVSCPYCDWKKEKCSTGRGAKNSLTAHLRGCQNAKELANK